MENDKLKCDIYQVIDDNPEPYSNAEENWRGLNPTRKLKREKEEEVTIDTTAKKRGKYLTACPDVTFNHNRPLRKKKGFLYKKWLVTSTD